MVTATKTAIEKFKKMIEKEGLSPSSAGIRFGVKAGGCSGFQYFLNVADKPFKDDQVVDLGDVKIFVDPKSMKVVQGTEIDWTGNLLESFVFKNPNAKSSCGCGVSFELKTP